jgi:hypothetical protein
MVQVKNIVSSVSTFVRRSPGRVAAGTFPVMLGAIVAAAWVVLIGAPLPVQTAAMSWAIVILAVMGAALIAVRVTASYIPDVSMSKGLGLFVLGLVAAWAIAAQVEPVATVKAAAAEATAESPTNAVTVTVWQVVWEDGAEAPSLEAKGHEFVPTLAVGAIMSSHYAIQRKPGEPVGLYQFEKDGDELSLIPFRDRLDVGQYCHVEPLPVYSFVIDRQ